MTKFKQPKKKSVDLGDGFISPKPPLSTKNPKAEQDIRKRFSQSYSPKADSFKGRVQSEDSFGYVSRSKPQPSDDVDLSLVGSLEDTASPKQKKSFFSRFRKSRKDRPRSKRIARGVAVSMIALLLGVGSLFTYGYLKARNIFGGNGEGAAALQENIDPTQLNGEGDGRVNILLLGKGGPGHEAPDLTDTILVASIDPLQNEAALLSVPRDFFVEDQNGNGTKINAVYSNAKQSAAYNGSQNEDEIENAGLRAIKKSVTDVIGIPIHYHVMVNFDAFESAIDTVGGITVDVKEPLYDQSVAWLLGGNPLVADRGLQTFDGERALLYARSRKGSARGDFDRTERQREVIVALQQKVISVGTFSNPFRIIELLDAAGDNVRTDLNGLGELKRLYEIGQKIGADRITSVGLADPPNVLVATDMIAGQSVVVPIAGLYQYDDIKSYVRNTLRDPFLKQEDARILILNGTDTPGLASATEKELKSFGYNVVGVGDAPEGSYPKSLLFNVAAEEKPFTESYLKRRISLEVSTQSIVGLPTSETADFVIILGEDEAIKATTN
jgi:LCP family protein required for cell wall assembly